MANKLYPPQIEGALPAFWLNYDASNTVIRGAQIKIPFEPSKAVNESQVTGLVLRLRTVSTGSYLFSPIFSTNFNLGNQEVTFNLSAKQASLLNEGQYYKVQIAYCGGISNESNTIEPEVGYFSTVGIIKCTSKPTVYINNLVQENVNFFTNEFVGTYDQSNCRDQTEKVYSYSFTVYDENDKIYFTTGEKLHLSSYDTEYSFSVDKVIISDFVKPGVTYSIQYKVTTMNNIELLTPKYKITNENLASPNEIIEIIPKSNQDNGYVEIKFKGSLDLNKSWYYVLDEKFLESEKDENGKYILDSNKSSAFSTIQSNLRSRTDKISFLKQNSLFKKYSKNSENKLVFIYTMTNNVPSGRILFRYEDEYRYILETEFNKIENNNLLSDEEKLNLILELPYYKLISNGRDLVKNLSYKYVEDNFITLKNYYNVKTGKIETLEEKEYYLVESVPYEAFYYGNYILSRASDTDNYSTWLTIAQFRLDEQAPSSFSFKDITVEHGRKYRYGLQQVNIWGMISQRIVSNIHEVSFEDMFLYDGDKLLKIRFNPKVDTFKTTILEQKSDTIGGRFPFITRNGESYYKEFPIGGLIASEMDEEQMFHKRFKGDAHRHSTKANGEDIYDENGKLITPSNIPENGLRDWRMFSDENILLEREFKIAVLDWLNDGHPKLFKSPYEGNYIIRLLNNQLEPVTELGRMLHSFTSDAYEIAECTYDNLVAYGFVNVQPPSNYVGLWRSYSLTDKSLLDNEGNILISFDAGLETFTVQDMMPGDIIYLQYFDTPEWEPIMIGITGSYTYTVGKDKAVSKLKIAPRSEIEQTSDRNTAGIVYCYYQGVRITAFDAIIGQQLRTIPSQQYIGVNPWMEVVRRQSWDIDQNEDVTAFDLTQAQYEGIQEYNFRDYLDDFVTQRESGTNISYQVNENFKKFITSFDPGELIDRINTTINKGEVYKIELINIEQAKFRLRDIIPVYVVDTEMHSSKWTGRKPFYGEKDQQTGIERKQDYQWVSVSPYGYPHRIEELTKFEMIDPYCIFEVFEMDSEHNWFPVQRESPYYDPYYRTWLKNYDPTFKINYHWKKIAWINNENNSEIIIKNNDALNRKNRGLPYNEDDIYDYIIQFEEYNNERKFYYINKLGHKTYLTDHFNLFYKEKNNYFSYGNETGVLADVDSIYFIKEYDTDISLATIKEKDYKELKDINSIHIGNGIIAELTFQIKVIDYYTEVRDEEVREAKNKYLQEKQFYSQLMKNYAIIANADYYGKKYSALKNAYDKLLNGTHNSYLSENDKYVLQELLKNNYEVEQLKLLTLYNIETIEDSLDPFAIQELIKYKQDHLNLNENLENPFGFRDILFFSSKIEDKINYYSIDNTKIEIKQPTINGDIDSDLENKTIFRQVNQNGEIIYFAINKNIVENMYKEKHSIMTLLGYNIIYQDDYSYNNNIDNIENGIISKENLITKNIKIEELNKINNSSITQIKQSLLTKDQVNELKLSDNFISISPIEINNNFITSFYEELELEKLMGEKNDYNIEGISNKYQDLQEEVNKFNDNINSLLELIETETTSYIEIYNKLKEAIDSYNEQVYTSWAYNELAYWLDDPDLGSSPTERILQALSGIEEITGIEYDALTARFNKLSIACNNLYYNILDNLPKILRFEQIKKDKDEDDDLDNYLELQIVEQRGQVALCAIAFYKAIFELKSLIDQNTKLQTTNNRNTFLSCLEKYNEIYQEIVDPITYLMKDTYYNGLVANNSEYGIKGYILTIFNKLITELELEKTIMNQSETYTNPVKLAELENYYEDLRLLLNWTDTTKITLQYEDESNIYSIYNIIYNPNFLNQNENHITLLTNLNNFNPRVHIGRQIQYYSNYQITQHDSVKNVNTYFYRTKIFVQSNSQPEGPQTNAIHRNIRFIFNPLNGENSSMEISYINGGTDTTIAKYGDIELENHESVYGWKSSQIDNTIKTNHDYYDQLSLEQKEQVLLINSKLIQIIKDFLTGKQTRDDGARLATYIRNNYLDNGETEEDNGKPLSIKELNKKRIALISQIIGDNNTELSPYAIYNNKILYAEGQLGIDAEHLQTLKMSEETRPFFLLNNSFDPNIIGLNKDIVNYVEYSQYYNTETMETITEIIRDDTNGSFNWAQSIFPINLPELGEVITDLTTGNQEISDSGFYYEYLQKLGGNNLKENQKLLEQANNLLQLYIQQYNNYNEKYNEYNKEFEEYNSIFNSFIGTEEMKYYLNDNNMTLEDYRKKVKQAWWAFLRILDYKYTKEREKGMYAQ